MSHVADTSPNAAPASPHLQATVQRAFGYADEQGHRQVTPEHLLLALTEDDDAAAVLQRKGIDLDRLRHDVAALMGRNNDRFGPGEPGRPDYGVDFRRVMGIAGAAASPRRPVDGALMLSALIADGVTPSAEIIKLYGLTFEDAARTSRPLRSVAPSAPAPASLANVRSQAREAALGYRLRKDPPEEFVALTPPQGFPPGPGPARFAEPPPPHQWPERSHTNGGPVAEPMTAWEDDFVDLPPPLEKGFAEAQAPSWQPDAARATPAAAPPDWNNYHNTASPQGREPQQPSTWNDLAAAPPQRPAPRTPRHSAEAPAAPKTKGRKPAGKTRRSGVDHGLLLENIPRRMVMGTAMTIEARIARRDIEAAILDLRLPEALVAAAEPVTHAMTVRLRSPDGAMVVEPTSPETQWIESTLGLLQDDFSSWRWTMTPRWTGNTQLQLIVSARAVTSQGLLGEMALPEQDVGVTVVSNYGSLLGSVAKWVSIALAAGIVGAVGEHMLKVVGRILMH